MGRFDVWPVQFVRRATRARSARVVWTRSEAKSYSRQRAAHRVHKPPLARALSASRPPSIIHGRRSRVHRRRPHAPLPRGPRQGEPLAPEAALRRQAPRRLDLRAATHHQRSVPSARLTASSFVPGGNFLLRAVSSSETAAESSPSPRRQVLVAGAAAAAAAFVSRPNQAAFAEGTKGFLGVIDRKAGYSFAYPFGWQEVSVQGQDKVYKDVIEPLDSVSINMIPTTKEDIRDLGPPDQVAEALVRKVLAPPTQKTKLIEAKQTEIDGRTYYSFEFTAQAPNFTRHALGTVTIANGKFYTLATGANERRWDRMKERLHTIVDSFKIETKV